MLPQAAADTHTPAPIACPARPAARRRFPGVLLELVLGLLGPLIHWAYAALVFDRLSRNAAAQRFAALWGDKPAGGQR